MGVCVNLCRVSEQLELALLRHWRESWGVLMNSAKKVGRKVEAQVQASPVVQEVGGSGPIRVYAYDK